MFGAQIFLTKEIDDNVAAVGGHNFPFFRFNYFFLRSMTTYIWILFTFDIYVKVDGRKGREEVNSTFSCRARYYCIREENITIEEA